MVRAHFSERAECAVALSDGGLRVDAVDREHDLAGVGVDVDLANCPCALDHHAIDETIPAFDGQDSERRLAADAGADAHRRDCGLDRLRGRNRRIDVDVERLVEAPRDADDRAAVHLAHDLSAEDRQPFVKLAEPLDSAPGNHRVVVDARDIQLAARQHGVDAIERRRKRVVRRRERNRSTVFDRSLTRQPRTTRKQHSGDGRTGNDFETTRHGYSLLPKKGSGGVFGGMVRKPLPTPFSSLQNNSNQMNDSGSIP